MNYHEMSLAELRSVLIELERDLPLISYPKLREEIEAKISIVQRLIIRAENKVN